MSSSEREKIGAEHRLDLGQLEAVSDVRLPDVLGKVIAGVIEKVLGEPGVELDTLNVLVTPEATEEAQLLVAALDRAPTPDVLHVRAFAERDRPA